jgi:hypothetical protein
MQQSGLEPKLAEAVVTKKYAAAHIDLQDIS